MMRTALFALVFSPFIPFLRIQLVVQKIIRDIKMIYVYCLGDVSIPGSKVRTYRLPAALFRWYTIATIA